MRVTILRRTPRFVGFAHLICTLHHGFVRMHHLEGSCCVVRHIMMRWPSRPCLSCPTPLDTAWCAPFHTACCVCSIMLFSTNASSRSCCVFVRHHSHEHRNIGSYGLWKKEPNTLRGRFEVRLTGLSTRFAMRCITRHFVHVSNIFVWSACI